MTPDKAVKKVWKLLLDPSIDKTLYIYIVINNKWYNQINIYASERFHSVKSIYIYICILVCKLDWFSKMDSKVLINNGTKCN